MNTENNKIIAEFLGYDTIVGITVVSVIKNNQLMVFNPNSDWNWLMESVTKCKENQAFGSQNLIDNIDDSLISTEMDLVYFSVVEFIKWHNEQK